MRIFQVLLLLGVVFFVAANVVKAHEDDEDEDQGPQRRRPGLTRKPGTPDDLVPRDGEGNEIYVPPFDKTKKYNDLIELMGDLGRNICMKLARHVRRKRFNAEVRCDLFVEQIEEMAENAVKMKEEMNITMQALVDSANSFPHRGKLRSHLKDAAKYILAKKRPSEKQVFDKLIRYLNTWLLHVALQKEGTKSGVEHMSREQIKALRMNGFNVPGLDEDEDDEEEFLMDEETSEDESKITEETVTTDYDEQPVS